MARTAVSVYRNIFFILEISLDYKVLLVTVLICVLTL